MLRAVALALLLPGLASAAPLAGRQYDVVGYDTHYSWAGSSLYFTAVVPDAGGALVEGFFLWVGNGGQVGHECVSGHYSGRDGRLMLRGYHVRDETAELTLGDYHAPLQRRWPRSRRRHMDRRAGLRRLPRCLVGNLDRRAGHAPRPLQPGPGLSMERRGLAPFVEAQAPRS